LLLSLSILFLPLYLVEFTTVLVPLLHLQLMGCPREKKKKDHEAKVMIGFKLLSTSKVHALTHVMRRFSLI
jgi:hypothetical protein